jgi:hypothetical protein
MRRAHIAALALGAGLLALPGVLRSGDAPVPTKKAEAPKVELKDVKYADLGKAIKGQRGKVVVVDVWAHY